MLLGPKLRIHVGLDVLEHHLLFVFAAGAHFCPSFSACALGDRQVQVHLCKKDTQTGHGMAEKAGGSQKCLVIDAQPLVRQSRCRGSNCLRKTIQKFLVCLRRTWHSGETALEQMIRNDMRSASISPLCSCKLCSRRAVLLRRSSCYLQISPQFLSGGLRRMLNKVNICFAANRLGNVQQNAFQKRVNKLS